MAYDDYIKNNLIRLKLEERELDIPQHTSALDYAIGILIGLGLAAIGVIKISGMIIGYVVVFKIIGMIIGIVIKI